MNDFNHNTTFNRSILDNNISVALKKYGGFFAFGNEQFIKAHKPKTKYVSMGAGLYAPKKTYKKLDNDIQSAIKNHIKRDLKINGIKKIIWRELANYECQIVGSVEDCVDALKDYGITKKQIMSEWNDYFNYCVEMDCF